MIVTAANYSPFSFPDRHLYESFKVRNFDEIDFPATPEKKKKKKKSEIEIKKN